MPSHSDKSLSVLGKQAWKDLLCGKDPLHFLDLRLQPFHGCFPQTSRVPSNAIEAPESA
jgi:hypothetical protein